MNNSSMIWQCRGQRLEIRNRPLVMGIVNVTPDSFSDGGSFLDPAAAVAHGLSLAEQGADLLDIGGESTRPGAESITLQLELDRVIPVVSALAKRTSIPLSVDTSKGLVARESLLAGAAIINDVTGLRGDPVMTRICAELRAGIIVMHMKGTPRSMQVDPCYSDVLVEVDEFFEERLRCLVAAGIDRNAICLDVGIGFGKKLEHNLELLANADAFLRFQRPICLGVSRKGFIGTLCQRSISERLAGSLAVNSFATAGYTAHLLRTHDVAATRDAVVLFESINHYRRTSNKHGTIS